MKRKIKNIIMIVLVGITCCMLFFTMNYAKNNLKSSNLNQNNMSEKSEMPQLQDENSKSDNTNQNLQEPPEKPDGNQDMSEPPEKPDGNQDMNEPPEKPSGDQGMEEPPALPEDSESSKPEPPNMDNSSDNTLQKPDGEQQEQPTNMLEESKTSIKLTTGYYIAFSIESVILAILLIYLIMSNFNKKGFKETFVNVDKVVIFILLSLVISACTTYASKILTEKYFLNSSTSEQKNMGASQNISYSASTEIKEDTKVDSGEYSSSNKDENAILVTGDVDVELSNISVTKTGDTDGGDNSNFYGNNSAILAKDGASLNLKNISVTTNASGANGVFSYGGSATTNNANSDGTQIVISDSTITTTGDNAGGIMTTGGGITKAYNLTINTSGTSSAAIRTDRGGGTVTVDGGTYTTTGQGSPSIYSTANISVSNASLISKASEGIVIEGKNSVLIDNCDLTDSNTKLNGKSTTYKNIFLYQSMSGDAADGNASFVARNSNITTNNGDTLYVTNTTATIELENNVITNNDSTGNFLRIQKDSWGNTGSNGGNVTLSLKNQRVTGNIVVDSISTLEMNLNNGSYYEGKINNENSAKNIALKIDSTSTIKLTGDSYVSSLEDEDTSYSNIDFNGYKLYVNGVAIN